VDREIENMNKPIFRVDFNEMLEPDLVLLSVGDTKVTKAGEVVPMYEGLEIVVYLPDFAGGDPVDNLVATGVVELNRSAGWGSRFRWLNRSVRWGLHVKWCCRIDSTGILYESDRLVTLEQLGADHRQQ
jgi:hypothetical protein